MMNKKMYNIEKLECISFICVCAVAVVLVLLMMTTAIIFVHEEVSEKNEIEGENNIVANESDIDHDAAIPSANASQEQKYRIKYNKNWNEDEKYMLAKIAMAEAEGESLETKVLIILTVLNRVHSNESYFPDTIREVIFQNRDGVYQFTPIANGRWDRVEPNDECWKAVNIVSQLDYDKSCGALYFEACSGESWHSRNLEFICESDNTRFYK